MPAIFDHHFSSAVAVDDYETTATDAAAIIVRIISLRETIGTMSSLKDILRRLLFNFRSSMIE